MKKDYRPILMYLLINIGLGVIIGILFSMFRLDENTITNLGTIIIGIIMFIIFFFIYKDKIINDFKKLTKKDLIFTIIMSLILIGGNCLLCLFIKSDNSNQDTINSLLFQYKILGSLVAGLLLPVVEEFVFRYSFDTICQNKWVFLIVSSLVFGFVHVIGVSAVIYIYIGIILAFIYLKTNKNILASSLAHSINNILSIIMLFLGL